MPIIQITIRDKIASAPPAAVYVTGNTDYVAEFAFDAEWEAYTNKTARFSTETQYIDVYFTGGSCPVPAFGAGDWLRVGVFAGNLSTTSAMVRMREGALSDDGLPEVPPDAYAQILERLDQLVTDPENAMTRGVYDPTGKATDIFAYADTAVEAERTRAEAAEGANADAITAERTRAEAAEASLRDEVASGVAEERTRAMDAEAALSAAVAAEEARAGGVEAGLRTDVDRANAGVAVLNGGAADEGSVAYQIAQAVAAIMENPDETINSIRELVDWIDAHAEDALALSNGLEQAKRDIDALELLVGEKAVALQIAEALAAALTVGGVDKYALATDLTAAVSRIVANEGAITAERTRAEAAEAANADAITAERTRAEAAEGVNADAITAERTRAEAAEDALAANQAKTNVDNQFSAPQTFNGGVVVNGDIIQNGNAYETHAEQLYTKKDTIILREGAVSGLAPGEYTGLLAKKYDGINDGRLVFGPDGVARVGDAGDEQALATRDEEIPDGEIVQWNAQELKLQGAGETVGNLATKAYADGVVGARLLSSVGGDTFQQTYSGKNLLDDSSGNIVKSSVPSINGRTVTFPSGGTGTCIMGFDFEIDLTAGETYSLCVTFNNADYASANMVSVIPAEKEVTLADSFFSSQDDRTVQFVNYVSGTNKTFTVTEFGKYRVGAYLHYYSPDTPATKDYTWVIGNCSLMKGSTATEYEPYVGGIPSPNPDYPQEIRCVKAGSKIRVVGKNLVSIPAFLSTANQYAIQVPHLADVLNTLDTDKKYRIGVTRKTLSGGTFENAATVDSYVYAAFDDGTNTVFRERNAYYVSFDNKKIKNINVYGSTNDITEISEFVVVEEQYECTYEPYVSTEITVPCDLYGIGDTCDTWNPVTGVVRKATGYIASYNGETVPTGYISTTGGLDAGATVVYPLASSVTEQYAPQPQLTKYASSTILQEPLDLEAVLSMRVVTDSRPYADSKLAKSMDNTIYDPQGYNQDVFAYINRNGAEKRYGVVWDKVNAKCTRRLWDAANITLDTANFGHFGSVNPNYDNPFDSIYPWSERRLCNYSIAAFVEISDTDGYDVRDAVVAWEGEDGFSYDPATGIGVGVYTPRFWHTSYDTDEGRVFAVSGTQVLGWNEAEPTIGGRWFGTVESVEIDGETKTVLGCRSGVPAGNIAMSTLHTYAKNGGMTIDDIYSYDATTVLAVVEYATMNSQNAIGNGCDSLYRQSSDKIMAAADNTNVVKVTKANASAYCIVGAIMDIGTGNGGRQIANRLITAVETDATDSTILNVTISGDPVSVTTDHYWSIHGIGNIADAEVGSRSGYIGTNGKCNAYYRGQVIHANLFRYVLGAYRQTGTGHIWIAKSRTQAEGYDTLDTTAHIDTGIVFQQGANGAVKEGYIKTLETTPGLSVPPFCDEVGGNSSNPVGDYCYVPALATGNTILLVGGRADYGALVGWLCGVWDRAAWYADWGISALPLSKSNKREV